jgi:hypothetical protein
MQYLSYILTFLGGLGTGVAIKFVIDIRRTSSSSSGATSTKQSQNRVGGHQAGRDVNVSGPKAQ